MITAAVVLFGTFFLLLLLNVPIALSLGAASLVGFLTLDLPLQVLPAMFFASTTKFSLLAIPLFILAGMIMERCGISDRLIRLATLIMGPVAGSLALVTVVVGILFAGISGSGPADVAALGAILIPSMLARGYKKQFTTGLMAAVGSIGIVVPPSIAFIIYGVLAEVSVGKLFMAGIIPGIIMGIFMGGISYVIARREGYRGERRGTLREIWAAFKEAIWGIIAPLIILGGLYGGIFTATEAAGIVVVYGLLVGLFVYREVRFKDLLKLATDSAVASAVVMFIVAAAGLFAWIIIVKGLAVAMTDALLGLTSSTIGFLMIANLILLLAGCFLDAISIFYITVPIFMPVVRQLGIDPIHFGVIMTVNLAIGQFTPPVGVNLYVAGSLGKASLKEVSAGAVPFILASVLALLLITLVPSLSTWIPGLMR